MASGRRIPEATVTRLPLYLRVLGEQAGRVQTLSSEELAARAGVNAAQVRKDLSYLGSYGTRGVGYDVAYLVREINRRLGLDGERRVAIVGAGNLGQALASYGGFPARGFHVVAAFDADPAKVGTFVGATQVQHVSILAEVLAVKGADIAVITTPAPAAQQVADALVAAGVRSILNFAPTGIVVPADVALRQVDLGIELQILSFYQQRLTNGPVTV
ncbi:MAG TPA: redox-sensing transcriptional repressor Rex [Acidimicrobiales bacterium]|jgi:redox-sensing transcriptional repressor|nr:redox-sensing transcriptional repressor Rex [Acidimicrobiales bacterium]